MPKTLGLAAPPDVLYHYTSLSGLKGIVESRELWASAIHYLNDEAEFWEAFKHLDRAAREFHRSEGTEAQRVFLRAMTRNILTLSELNLCVFSLSERGDLLSQWRGYCPAGSGYAIGFETQGLLEFARPLGFSLERCNYTPRQQGKVISGLLNNHLEAIARDEVAHAPDSVSPDTNPFYLEFIRLAPRIKNPAFSEEKEWRLVSDLKWADDPHMGYREGSTMLIPHYAIPADPLPIQEVIVGPTRHMRLAVRAMQHYLGQKKVRSQVIPSKVPYRT